MVLLGRILLRPGRNSFSESFFITFQRMRASFRGRPALFPSPKILAAAFMRGSNPIPKAHQFSTMQLSQLAEDLAAFRG